MIWNMFRNNVYAALVATRDCSHIAIQSTPSFTGDDNDGNEQLPPSLRFGRFSDCNMFSSDFVGMGSCLWDRASKVD